MSSRTARATQRNPVAKNERKKEREEEREKERKKERENRWLRAARHCLRLVFKEAGALK